MHQFTTEGLYPPPCDAHFNIDECALFNYFGTVEQKHPLTPILMLGRARTFRLTPIGFV